LLKNTKLKSILPVLRFGTNTQDLRKTVFELVAFRAVDFFSNTEKMTVRPAYEFSLNDEKFYWPAEKFSQMKLVSSDSTHMHFYTVKLFQELLKMNADDVSARIDADLIRLKFVHQNCKLSNNTALYKAALTQIEKQFPDNEQAAMATVDKARLERSNTATIVKADEYGITKNRLARDLPAIVLKLKGVMEKFPKSQAAAEARNLIHEMESPSLNAQVEEVVLPGAYSKTLITYQNVSSAQLTLYKISMPEFIKYANRYSRNLEKLIEKGTRIETWPQALPNAHDLEVHSGEARIPQLEIGQYLLVVKGKVNGE